MKIKELIEKTVIYLNVKYLRPILDDKYWSFVSTDKEKIKEIINFFDKSSIPKFYPSLNLEVLLEREPKVHNIIKHRFSKYAYEIKHALIEPEFGWVIIGLKKIFKYSFPMVEDPWDARKPRPSLLKYIFRKEKKMGVAISVRYAWQNYYHFIIDTLPQIRLLDELGVPGNVPVIVPFFFNEITFVKDYLLLSRFTSRPFIVQGKNEFFKVAKLYVAKDTFFSPAIIDFRNSLISKVEKVGEKKRIFVTRSQDYGRTMSNLNEIESIAVREGFIIIEAASLNIRDQIKLFRNASCIVGIHGAGLANIIFSKDPNLKILEIYPGAGLAPEHYKNIAIMFGFKYYACFGSGMAKGMDYFQLDPMEFKAALTNIIND